MFDPATITTVVTYVGLGTAYYFLSRPIGFVIFLLATGEIYPKEGYYGSGQSYRGKACSDIWPSNDGSPQRFQIWIPFLGEIIFSGWVLWTTTIGFVRTAKKAFLNLGTVGTPEKVIHRLLHSRKAKQISEEDLYAFVRENPEAYRKALEEVDNL